MMTQHKDKDTPSNPPVIYEILYENWTIGQSWIMPIFFTILVFSMYLAHHFIRDVPRHWNFGSVNDIPGASIYSTNNVRGGEQAPLQQMETWPEAKPLN